MRLRLQDDLQEHAVHGGELIRLPVESTMRARQAEQDHLVAPALGLELGWHKVRGRDVGGPRQLAPRHLSLGGRAQQQRRRPAPRQVLSLLQSKGLSSSIRLGAVRHRAQHPRQHRVSRLCREHRQHRSTQSTWHDQVLSIRWQIVEQINHLLK